MQEDHKALMHRALLKYYTRKPARAELIAIMDDLCLINGQPTITSQDMSFTAAVDVMMEIIEDVNNDHEVRNFVAEVMDTRAWWLKKVRLVRQTVAYAHQKLAIQKTRRRARILTTGDSGNYG